VSGQIDALLRLVEICVDGGLEATMYETQAQLADAYLERQQGLEARVIAEDLVAREPWEHAHIERFRRALEMLGVPEPDALIADRLAGQGPFVATDPFMAAESFDEGSAQPILTRAEDRVAAAAEEPVATNDDEGEEPAVVEPDIPLRPRAAAPAPPPAAKPPQAGRGDIDLSQALEQIGDAAPGATQNLDEVFNDFRSEVSKQSGVKEAAEQLGLGKTYLEMGMADEAVTALRAAARAPVHRYELGALLEMTGETARALAVFLELQAEAGEYRDVAARVERLSKVQAGG
jgi:tetratricopeptide (TPR) repeat protein